MSTFAPEQPLSLEPVLDGLTADGLLSADDAGELRQSARLRHTRLHPLVLIGNRRIAACDGTGELDIERLTQWLARQVKLPYRKLDPTKIDAQAVTRSVSEAYARRFSILPISDEHGSVTFATCEPMLTSWMDELQAALCKDIIRVIASPTDVNRMLTEHYSVSRSVQFAANRKGGSKASIASFEQLVELGRTGQLNADDQHIVAIVDWLLQFAFQQRASDIHLEPRRDVSQIRFRIDGDLHQVYTMPTPVMAAVVSRIKILARLDVAEKRRPQDGRIKTRTPGGQEIELRVSTMATAFGEKTVARIFDPELVFRDFDELGFSDQEITTWRDMVERPNGIVLITGPTGSGKTTTLYSTLEHLARPEVNVCTIEDPIEMVSPRLNQMQVQSAIDVGFAQGVKTLLRQDPDIIMIGEIRDLPTAEMAVQASLTGHVVLSSLHTNDAPSAIPRLLNLGVPHYLLQSTLVGVVAQRLLRKLCHHCRRPGPVDDAAWSALVHPWKISPPSTMGHRKGCVQCRETGFLGRTAIYEMMKIDGELQRAIQPEASSSTLTKLALEAGMRPLRIAGARQVGRGTTTIEEVIRVAPVTMHA